jgi:UDP-N-acetylglucosamine acyltransferase
MVQGGSKINKDVPPYIIAAREPISYCGINSVGLNRRAFSKEQIDSIQQTYRLLYMSGLNVSQAVTQIEETLPATPERDLILEFVKGSPRGIVRGYN